MGVEHSAVRSYFLNQSVSETKCTAPDVLDRFTLSVVRIPRLAHDDPRLIPLMQSEKPVIITGSNMVRSSVLKWTPEYLCKTFDSSYKSTVFESDSVFFKYWDDTKNLGKYVFTPSTRKLSMTWPEFYERFKAQQAKAKSSPPLEMGLVLNEEDYKHVGPYLYLQQALTTGVGSNITEDFTQWNFKYALTLAKTLKWGSLTTNSLFVGVRGVITPAHYDEQENLFAQIYGRKRFILFPPSDYECMYPYPLNHPNDRQSQVNIHNPDLTTFTNFAFATPHEAVIHPGDVLYVPSYWWHHVISLDDSISVSWWFLMQPVGEKPQILPLTTVNLVAMRRNIERMVSDEVGPTNVETAFLSFFKPEDQQTSVVSNLKNKIIKLLLLVMPLPQVDPYLQSIIRSRFGRLTTVDDKVPTN